MWVFWVGGVGSRQRYTAHGPVDIENAHSSIRLLPMLTVLKTIMEVYPNDPNLHLESSGI